MIAPTRPEKTWKSFFEFVDASQCIGGIPLKTGAARGRELNDRVTDS